MTRNKVQQLTEIEKINIGESYYYSFVDDNTGLSVTAIKVLLFTHATLKAKSYPFRLSLIPYKGHWSIYTQLNGVNELVKAGYLTRTSRQMYIFNDRGVSLVRSFWERHTRKFTKYTSKTVPE